MLQRGGRLSQQFSKANEVVAIDNDFGAVYVTCYCPRLEVLYGSESLLVDCRDVPGWPQAPWYRLQGRATLVSLSPLSFRLELSNRDWNGQWLYEGGALTCVSMHRSAHPRLIGLRTFVQGSYLLQSEDNLILLPKGESTGYFIHDHLTHSPIFVFDCMLTVQIDGGAWAVCGIWQKFAIEAKFAIPGPRCVFLIRGRTIEHIDTLTHHRTVLASSLGRHGGIALPKNMNTGRIVYVPKTGDLLLLRQKGTIVPLTLRNVVAPPIDLNANTFSQFPPDIRDLIRTFLCLARRTVWGRLSRTMQQYLLSFVFMNVPCVLSFFGRLTK